MFKTFSIARTKDWGIEVSAVEIRDVQLTDNMAKAIAPRFKPLKRLVRIYPSPISVEARSAIMDQQN
jgi:hypothetical protein